MAGGEGGRGRGDPGRARYRWFLTPWGYVKPCSVCRKVQGEDAYYPKPSRPRATGGRLQREAACHKCRAGQFRAYQAKPEYMESKRRASRKWRLTHKAAKAEYDLEYRRYGSRRDRAEWGVTSDDMEADSAPGVVSRGGYTYSPYGRGGDIPRRGRPGGGGGAGPGGTGGTGTPP